MGRHGLAVKAHPRRAGPLTHLEEGPRLPHLSPFPSGGAQGSHLLVAEGLGSGRPTLAACGDPVSPPCRPLPCSGGRESDRKLQPRDRSQPCPRLTTQRPWDRLGQQDSRRSHPVSLACKNNSSPRPKLLPSEAHFPTDLNYKTRYASPGGQTLTLPSFWGSKSKSAAGLAGFVHEPCLHLPRAPQKVDCIEHTVFGGGRREKRDEAPGYFYLQRQPVSQGSLGVGTQGLERPSPEFSACAGLSPSQGGTVPNEGATRGPPVPLCSHGGWNPPAHDPQNPCPAPQALPGSPGCSRHLKAGTGAACHVQGHSDCLDS